MALAALFVTVLNAAKPVTVDDTVYYLQALNFLEHPLRPYTGSIFWFQTPQPAIEIVIQPAFVYWLSGAIAIFGEAPALWKLTMFPWLLLLAAAIRALAGRVAAGRETAAIWLLLFSPLVLPGVNLMLDVPTLALALASVALFLRALERGGAGLVLLAGAVAGLAMLTKYTGLSAVAGIAAFGLLQRAPLRAAGAGAIALALFAAWEVYVWSIHGTGQLAGALMWRGETPSSELSRVFMAFVTSFGFLAAALLPVAAALYDGRLSRVLPAAGLVLLAVALIPVFPPAEWSGEAFPPALRAIGPGGILGLATWAVIAWAGVRVLRRRPEDAAGISRSMVKDPIGAALILWLVLEIAITISLSPFPAARRFVFLGAVALLLVLRAAPPAKPGAASWPLVIATVTGALFGLFVWAVGLIDSRNERLAALAAARTAETEDPDARRWFTGHWGFQYYALQAGMRPLVPGGSRIRAGDLIVVPMAEVDRQGFRIGGASLAEVARLHAGVRLPWSAKLAYYGGMHPVHGRSDTRVPVTIYRATRAFVPAPGG